MTARKRGIMDLKILNTFKAIVDEGSFSKAAKRLNYTQSTITFHIGQLEKDLHVKLFEKVGRRMVLTKAGEELVPYVEEVIQSVNKMSNFQTDLTECTGDLRIGAPESLLCFYLPFRLKEFHARAPHVHLLLQSMNSGNTLSALKNDDIDIGLFYDTPDYGPALGVARKRLGSFPLSFYASSAVKQKYNDFITADQHYPLLSAIVQPPKGSLRRMFDGYMKEKNISLGNRIELRSTQTIKNLAVNDVGICFLPEFVVQAELERGELEELETDRFFPPIEGFFGYRESKWMSPAMKLICEVLNQEK